MDTWLLRVNNILKHEITKLDNTLIPSDFQGDTKTLRHVQETVSAIIDRLGEYSATAQGLNKVITTGSKMRCNQNYILYLLKDATANNGQGEVIGLLKMGNKHLYLGDRAGKVYEVDPLCVLDFFVQRDRQRHGLGKKLFDYMLKDIGTEPHHLAVDGPSPVMLQFLEKAYGMSNMIRHANNFAVAPAFFDDINKISKSGCSTPASSSSGAGRFTAHKPQSGIGKIIHGGNQEARTISSMCREECWPASPARSPPPPRSPAARPAAASPSPVETEAGDRSPPERPCTLLVEAAAALQLAEPPSPAGSAAGSAASRRDSQLTDKGFFDVKFYHNKLW